MNKKIKIIFNKSKCIGCGACVAICPNFFEMKDGFANLKNSKKIKNQFEIFVQADEDSLLFLEQASRNCPVKAINIEKNQ
mgnify:FL=1